MAVHFVLDHFERGLEVLDEYTDNEDIRKILKPLLEQVQQYDEAVVDASLGRFLEIATGFSLEMYGKLVKRRDFGVRDYYYRKFIEAQIGANNSNTSVPLLMDIYNLIAGETDSRPILYKHNPAGYHLTVVRSSSLDEDIQDDILDVMQDAEPGAFGTVYTESLKPAFQLDSDENGLGSPISTRILK